MIKWLMPWNQERRILFMCSKAKPPQDSHFTLHPLFFIFFGVTLSSYLPFSFIVKVGLNQILAKEEVGF